MRKMHRVVVLDELAREGLDLLQEAEEIEFDVRKGLKGDELREVLFQYDGALCRSGVEITGSIAGSAPLFAPVLAPTISTRERRRDWAWWSCMRPWATL